MRAGSREPRSEDAGTSFQVTKYSDMGMRTCHPHGGSQFIFSPDFRAPRSLRYLLSQDPSNFASVFFLPTYFFFPMYSPGLSTAARGRAGEQSRTCCIGSKGHEAPSASDMEEKKARYSRNTKKVGQDGEGDEVEIIRGSGPSRG